MKRFLIILLGSLLIGCASTPPPAPTVPEPKTRVVIDARILKECDDKLIPLTKIEGEDISLSIIKNTAANRLLYDECKEKHKAAVILLKKFSNTETE